MVSELNGSLGTTSPAPSLGMEIFLVRMAACRFLATEVAHSYVPVKKIISQHKFSFPNVPLSLIAQTAWSIVLCNNLLAVWHG